MNNFDNFLKFRSAISNTLPFDKMKNGCKHFLMNYYISNKKRNSVNFGNWLHKINNQFGGSIQDYKYGDATFRIKIDESDGEIIITSIGYTDENTLFKNSESSMNTQCFMAIKSAGSTFIVIQGLENNEDCFKGERISKRGTIMLEFLISYLKKKKEKLGINRIVLTDNSLKYCPECDKKLNLSEVYILSTGDTWYGKFGFRPYNEEHDTPDEDMLSFYTTNKDIMNTIKMKNFDLIKLVKTKMNEKNEEIIERNLEFIQKLQTEYPNTKLRKVLKLISQEDCCLMAHMSKYIFRALGLTSFYKMTFYLDI